MTNADKIRSMTDKRLLEFFCIDVIDHPCPPDTSCCPGNDKFVTCMDCWKRWLKEEVQNDTEKSD